MQQICTLKTLRPTYGKFLYSKLLVVNIVENMLTKGEIAHYEQYFLLSYCFQHVSAAEAPESIYM